MGANATRARRWLELVMALLGIAWLGLLVADLAWTLPRWASRSSTAIWVVFIAEFGLELAFARDRRAYLRSHWFTALSLLLPALRIFSALRAMRAVGAVRGLQLAGIVTRLGTAKSALATLMQRHGLQYVLVLTVFVTFAGAAGMFAFERDSSEGFRTYGDSLWWTAMLITTIASQSWPVTLEGRLLAVLLSAYALGVLGYITAALSAFLIGRDAGGRSDGKPGDG